MTVHRSPRNALFAAGTILLAPLAVLYVTQAIWLESLSAPFSWMADHPKAAGLFWVLFSCLSLTLCGFIRRLFWAYLPGTAACILLAYASRCKMDINDAPLQLSDFAFLGNLGELTGFAADQLLPSLPAGLAMGLAILLLVLLARKKSPPIPATPGFLLGSLALALTISACYPGFLQNTAVKLGEDCQNQLERNEEMGVVLGIYSAWAQRLQLEKAAADGDILLLAEQFITDALEPRPALSLKEAPDIIFITSESFFDVTRLPGLEFEKDPLPVFHGLAEEHTNGPFLSNTYGGGTGYVEMEMFTGLSSTHLMEGDTLCTLDLPVYETIPTTVRLLKQLGYSTLSVHAHSDALYNRSSTYPAIGFQEAVFLEDFITEPKKMGNYTSDQSFAKEIIARYEARDKDVPAFIYGLSMENHQAYYPEKYPTPSGYPAQSSRLSSKDLAILDALVMGLHDADASLGMLVDYFSQADRPVMLVFVGDHLPSLNLADGTSLYNRLGYFPAEDNRDPEATADKLSTDYLIWTNYERTPQPDRMESCTFLGLHALQRARLPLNDYFSWLAEDIASQMLFSLNWFFVDAEGNPYDAIPQEAQAAAETYADLEHTLLYRP